MLRWILMLRKLFTATPTRTPPPRLYSKQQGFRLWVEWLKDRRPRPTVKLTLQELEGRIVPSGSTTNSLAGNAAMSNTSTAQVAMAESFFETAQQIKTQVASALTHAAQELYSDWVAIAAYENPVLAAWLNTFDIQRRNGFFRGPPQA